MSLCTETESMMEGENMSYQKKKKDMKQENVNCYKWNKCNETTQIRKTK